VERLLPFAHNFWLAATYFPVLKVIVASYVKEDAGADQQ
jgi:hypothetical protein